MRTSFISIALGVALLGAGPAAVAPDAAQHTSRFAWRTSYQGRNRGPEDTERFSRKVRIGRDGRVTVTNIAGDIVVTGGGGDEVSIEAIKHTRGGRGDLANVQITVDSRPDRVDIRTDHTGRNDRVSVDYTVAVPASVSVEIHSVSGDVKVTNVEGAVRAESVSGGIVMSGVPRVELAKSVSGDVELSGATATGDLSAGSVSGSVHVRGVKARSLELGTVSGDIGITDASCERVEMKSVSGELEYSGALAKNGSYNLNSHSGDIRLTLAGDVGFELNADSFSGSIRSALPLTLGPTSGRDERRGGIGGRRMRARFGDGSAVITARTFSGDIVVQKR